MKITSVECLPLIHTYEKPIYDASFKAGQRQALIVKVNTDSGIYGLGEAASFGGPLVSTSTIVEREIAPLVVGEDPFSIERIWQKVYHRSWQHARGGVVICALSGIDVALWDILGKAAGLPVYKLLGGYSNRIRAYASGGFYSEGKGTEQIAREMAGYVAKGYTAVKMKVGRNDSALNPLEVMPDPGYKYSLDEDLERVHAVKRAVGKDVRLLVDANAAWDLHTAMVMGREFDKAGVYLLEEPVSTDNVRGSAELAAALDLKIAGYESEQLAYKFERLIRERAIDLAQPDLAWSGGFTECRKIADLAYANHMEVAPHCFSSAVNLMASLHFLGAYPNGGMLEFDQNPNGLRTDIMKDLVAIDSRGYVEIPDKPGLGIELDMEAIERFLVKP